MADPLLPPSRFGAGYSVGADPRAGAARTTALNSSPPAHARAGTIGPSPVDPAVATAAPKAEVNLLAVAAFVLTLLWGPFLLIVTIPMALRARAQVTRRRQSGGGLAVAALVLGGIYLITGVMVVVLAWQTHGPIGAGWR